MEVGGLLGEQSGDKRNQRTRHSAAVSKYLAFSGRSTLRFWFQKESEKHIILSLLFQGLAGTAFSLCGLSGEDVVAWEVLARSSLVISSMS